MIVQLSVPSLTSTVPVGEAPATVTSTVYGCPTVWPPAGAIESIVVVVGSERERLEVDGVFVETGSIPVAEFTAGLVETNERGEILVDRDGSTEVVILNAGSLRDDPAAELLISVADLALAEVRPQDRSSAIAARIAQLDLLPRQGGVLAFTGARAGDPGLLP